MNNKSLIIWRKQIDLLDDEFLNILQKRINIVKKIGTYKKINNIQPLDEKRWQKLLQSRIKNAHSLGISEKFVKKLYKLIHEYSLEIENNI